MRTQPNTANPNQVISITFNGQTIDNVTVRSTVEAGIPMTTVTAPANTLMLGSTNGLPLMAIDIDDLRPGGFPGVQDTPCEAAVRVKGSGIDNGGYCMAYVDGHSKWVKFNGTLSPFGAEGSGVGTDPYALSDYCSWQSDYSDTSNKCQTGFK